MPDHLRIDAFLPPDETRALLTELRELGGRAAEVYGNREGGAIDARVRSARRLDVPSSLLDRVLARLTALRETLGQHFGFALTEIEEPQFLRYRPGDFFVAHQDGNTGLIYDDSRHRRVSVVVFLNTDYEGGALTLHGAYPNYDERTTLAQAPGTLIAFRSETTHEVLPVTAGERYTIVSWYRVTP